VPSDATLGEQVSHPDERAGARTFAEHDERKRRQSRIAAAYQKTTRKTDQVMDGAKLLGSGWRHDIVRVPPTGQATTTPNVPVIHARPVTVKGTDVASAFTLVAVPLGS
jgi:hypothetical protein